MTVGEKAKQQLAERKNGGSNGNGAQVPATFQGMKSSQIKAWLEKFRGQIEAGIPKHMTADRAIQVATTLINRTPGLQKCSFESIIGVWLTASQLGLELTPQLGLAYAVPFWNKKTKRNEAQFIIGYRGMLALARRSGEVETAYAFEVYENDDFSYSLGLDPDIQHTPATGDRGMMTHVYAVMKYKGGGHNFVVMSRDDVDKIRKRSQAGDSDYSPWNTDYEAMARKTAIRQLFKYAPTSTEILTAMAADGGVASERAVSETGEIDLNEIEQTEAEVVEDEAPGTTETTNVTRESLTDLIDAADEKDLTADEKKLIGAFLDDTLPEPQWADLAHRLSSKVK